MRRLREKGKSKEGQSKEEGNEGGDLGEGEEQGVKKETHESIGVTFFP